MTDPAAQTGPWEVFVLEYAHSHAQAVASLVHGAYAQGATDVPFAFVAARSPHGVLLVDTGFIADAGGGKVMAERFDIPTWVHPLRLLATIGVAADAVTDIVLSHAHFDHMGAIDQFPRARLHIQKRELLSWVEAMALPPRFAFLTDAVDPEDIQGAIAAASEHRLNLLDGDRDDVLPGVHVRLAADSHTLGSQWVALDTAKGRFVVSGDCIYSYQNLAAARPDGKHVPLGFGVGSVWQQLMAMDRISETVAGDLSRILILHDFDRWKQCVPVAEIDGLKVVRAA